VKWRISKERFLKKQEANNNIIDEQRKAYLAAQPDAIIDYCERVLSGSKYSDDFPQEYDMDYRPDTKTLLLDYLLPFLEHIPRLKEVKHIASKNELKESLISESAHHSLFDSALYQIAIRTLRELFEVDIVKGIGAIALNGWVEAVDKGTGQEIKVCVLSAFVNRGEFEQINLSQVDPKVCFKKHKGVAATKLYGLTPIGCI